jgi:O-antigen ligase
MRRRREVSLAFPCALDFHGGVAVPTQLGVSRGIFGRLQVGLELRLDRIVAAVSFAVIAVLGFADGAYLQKTWRLGLLALLALLAAALLARERISLRPGAVVMVAALGGLAGWTALSTFWADVPSMPPPEAERTLVYVAAILVVFAGCSESSVPYLLGGVLAGITADCAYGLLRYLFWPPARSPVEGTLLFLPLGYANAVGIFAAIGVVLAVGLALSATGWMGRAVSLAPLLVLVPTLSLTSSRGAWAALPFGLATLLYVGGRVRAVVLAPLLVAGVLVGVLLGSSGGQTLSIVGQNRPQYWHVAWKLYESNSLLGGGAGTFGNYWLHNRPNGEFVRDAHSLYIETLGELGPLGLALLLLALVTPLLALRRRNTMIAAAAAGAYVTFLLHAAVDWDWELPVVTIVGLTCGAALLVEARPGRQLELGVRARGLLLAGASTLAAFISAKLGASELVGLVGCKSFRDQRLKKLPQLNRVSNTGERGEERRFGSN